MASTLGTSSVFAIDVLRRIGFVVAKSTRRKAVVRRLRRRESGSPVVTKKEIVKTISDEIGLTQLKTKEIVQKTFDAIVETLVEEKRIELRNFGVFEVKKRAARKARNPRTGDKVYVPEKYVVTFKPGKEMEEKVRELERQAAERAAAMAAQQSAQPADGSSQVG
jgi:nucleoid DNA-binding protein